MRGRGLCLVAGMKMGEKKAEQEVAMKQQAAQQGAQQAQAQQAAVKPAPAAGGDVTAQLQNLAQMHTSGVLSDEEFAAAKKKLLC
jgi:hypothetical protein